MGLGELCIQILANLLYKEFQAWRPYACRAMLRLGLVLAPKHQRERLAEEWASWTDDVPGDLAKLLVAFGFILAGCHLTMSSWWSVAQATVTFFWITPKHFWTYFKAGRTYRLAVPRELLRHTSMPAALFGLKIATQVCWLCYQHTVLGIELPPKKIRSPGAPSY